MPYLQDDERASRLAQIDSTGIRRLPALRSRLLKRTVARNVSGHLGVIAGRPAALYVAGGRLWMAIDGQAWHFDDLTAQVHQNDWGHTVTIKTPADTYELVVENAPDPQQDVTALADAEDFSFALWMARVIADPQRQEVLREVLVDAGLDEVPMHASAQRADRWRPSDAPTGHRRGEDRPV